MATGNIYTTDGTLIESFYDSWSRSVPYANLTLETRLESILNYFMETNNAAGWDYQMGGYLRYGLLPDGRFKIDLDAFSLTFVGTFSTRGSTVRSINLIDAFGGVTIYEGVFNYQGLPFFTPLWGTSSLSTVGRIEPNGTDRGTVFLNATVSPELYIQGQIQGISSTFVDSSGNSVEDSIGGGNIFFSNGSGSMDVVSGYFTSAYFGSAKFPPTRPNTVIDYIKIDNAYVPLSATSASFDILSGNDYIALTGSRGSLVYTSTGNDTVYGSPYADTIHGEAGNDFLIGHGGNDLIYGGPGIDTASYRGQLDQYAVTVQPSITTAFSTVRDLNVSRDGTDSVQHVERLQFLDKNLALDITGISAEAYRIYKAAFNRTPDLQGLGYWILQMDNGATVPQVASGFIGSAEFQSLYGTNPSNNQFVDLLYQNVLGRNPDAGGYAYWNAMLSNGLSRADVLAYFSESSENVVKVAPLISNGIEYIPFSG
jgi:Ca2+-binding RTX toxin-like protein